MVVEPGLLESARQAGSQLAEAERRLQLARAEYHTSVRRLHLAGASLREVAQALGLSHQRVQQIVDGAGGTWWQRIRRGRDPKRDAVCTFCDRPPSEVAKLVAGPNVFICDLCLGRVESALRGDEVEAGAPKVTLAGATSRTKCSFCGKGKAKGRPVAITAAAGICVECAAICRTIVGDGAT